MYNRMPAAHKPRGQVSLKCGSDESADVPAVSPASFDINAAACYGMSWVLQ